MKNKRIFKLVLFFFLSSSALFGQTPQDTIRLDSAYLMKEIGEFFDFIKEPKPRPFMYIEFHGGLNYGLIDRKPDYQIWVSDEFETFSNWETDWMAGVNSSFLISKRLELGFGVDYSRISSSAQVNVLGDSYYNVSVSETAQWLSVPLTGKFRLIRQQRFGFYTTTGLINSFLLKSEFGGYRSGTLPVEIQTKDYTTLRKKWMGSLMVGLGMEYLTYGSGFFLEARYEYGIGDRTNESQRYSNQDVVLDLGYVEPTTYIRNFGLRVGYKWLIKKKPIGLDD